MRQTKFHGRFEDSERECAVPGCDEPGEFRAPGSRGSSFDGPGDWRWLCLDHVRAFNAGYDYFEGMSAEAIFRAQSAIGAWESETRAFATNGSDGMPRWADFSDPLDAIGARAEGIRTAAGRRAAAARPSVDPRFTRAEIEALDTMGLGRDADRRALRRRYGELVRRYHPDRNGGDRRYEVRLARVVDAYKLLRESTAIS